MYLSSLQGHGTSCCPGASGAPTLCMHGTTRRTSRSISSNTGMPVRAMIRMLTTTYGESVSWTPTCDIGEPTMPMLNGSTYMVRPSHRAVEEVLQLAPHLVGVLPVVGRAGGVLGERADERALFDAGDVAGVRARVVAARARSPG